MDPVSKTPLLGQSRQRELLKSATTFSYRQTDEGPLQAHFFVPPDFDPSRSHTTAIFFHGGLWESAMPTQFAPHCLRLAARGALAIAVETRVKASHGTGAEEALEDAALLMAWLGQHAEKFGIDRRRVILAGASGGAYLALQQVLPKRARAEVPMPLEPAALVLVSALVDTQDAGAAARFRDSRTARRLSPVRQLRRGLPPILMLQGKADRFTPFDSARRFARKAKWRGNRVELLDFENADHSFFNFNVSDRNYELTLGAADAFLVGLGMLEQDELAGV